MIRKLVVDLRPLRSSPAFARLYAGSLASGVGSAMTTFAVLFQIWQITHSPAATGLLALLRAIPLFVLTPLGGTLADRRDRRTIMFASSLANAFLVALLAVQALAGWRQVWLLYVVVVMQASVTSLGQPARQAILPLLVPRDQVAAARALNTLSWQLTALAGPVLAGVVVATWGLRSCYAIDVVSYVFGLIGIAGLPTLIANAPPEPHLSAMLSSLKLVGRHRPLLSAFGIDMALTVLAFPIGLMPALNQSLGGDARTLGILMSCLGVGGVAAALASGGITRANRPGASMTVTAVLWCVAVVGLGLSPGLLAAYVCMIAWGAADILFGIPRGTLVQLASPDEHRGRIAAANGIVGNGGPAIGDARAGLLASAVGAGPALVFGGLCALAATLIVSWKLPEARSYEITNSEEATMERC
ncbi:MFS transporter [Micromonospora lupini]|uniref:MFS transporter n=1 Tax=Micromonospora lupini TaxID=285679 RepID=UPI00225BF71B|nr:MFS transporter [Micromonospora lupini]MCX5065977.1 MFS transporter [Micromonospora lupini]